MIEIQSGDARTGGQGGRPRSLNDESPFAGVFENHGASFKTTRDDEVNGAVVVVVRSDRSDLGRIAGTYGLTGLIGESSIAIVAQHSAESGQLNISAGGWRQTSRIQTWISRGLRHEQVQVAVVIVVDESQPDVEAFDFNSRGLGDIFKGAVFLIVQQQDAIPESYGQIRSTVVVIIASGAADGVQCRIETCFLRHVFELAIAQIVVERHSAFFAVVGQKDVEATVVVIIKKARAGPEVGCKILRGRGRGFCLQSSRLGYIYKPHWNLRRNFLNHLWRFFRE